MKIKATKKPNVYNVSYGVPCLICVLIIYPLKKFSHF